MLKKIILFIILISLTYSCDYSPIHSSKANNIKIEIIYINGDNEINDYISKDHKTRTRFVWAKLREKTAFKINRQIEIQRRLRFISGIIQYVSTNIVMFVSQVS